MTSYGFPHHDNRSFAIASDDVLPWVLLYRQTRKWLESRLCRLFYIILNGRKNALWERQETGQWHRVKNLLPWMTSYGFPRHDNRSFAIARDDALPSPSLRQQILRWRSEWRLAIRRHSALLAASSQLTAHSYQPSFPFRKIRVIYKNSGKRHSVFIFFHV